MAYTYAQVATDPHSTLQGFPIALGDVKATTTAVTADATSYTTGGLAATPANFGLSQVLFTLPGVQTTAATATGGANQVTYNPSSQKLQFWAGTGLELANATTTMAGAVFNITAFGY